MALATKLWDETQLANKVTEAGPTRAARIASIETMLGRVGTRNQLLIKLTTEDGLVGWGESGLSGRERAVMAAVAHMSDYLVGQDARRIGRIWQESYRSQYFEGGRILTAAISAIDIALYDNLGKRLGVPVHQLLGGKQRDVVPTFASTMAETIDEMLRDVQLLVDAGWDCVRTYPAAKPDGEVYDPRAALSSTAEELVAIRAEFGQSITLGIDWHHRLSVAEAASFCNMMPSGTLDFIEEPIRAETPEAYGVLRGMTNIPFAVGEEFSSKWEAARYLEAGHTQFIRLDICNIGGFTEAMKVAGWSERHYVDLMPHNPLGPICTAATVHMSAAVPNFSWLETRTSPAENFGFADPTLFPVQPELRGPVYIVSDAPGLGVEVNEDAFRNGSVEHVECPHWVRPDGSVTNW